MAMDEYTHEFANEMLLLPPVDFESQSAAKLMVRSAVIGTQNRSTYIGDKYDVELPTQLEWYAEMMGRGTITSYAWISEDSVLPIMLEKYSTSSRRPYAQWMISSIWRIIGDGWDLTFGEGMFQWDNAAGAVLFEYETPAEVNYHALTHKVSKLQSPRLIGDEEKFRDDLCLIKLLER
jgi:hypothetical protein